jgi:hypothetical protein
MKAPLAKTRAIKETGLIEILKGVARSYTFFYAAPAFYIKDILT